MIDSLHEVYQDYVGKFPQYPVATAELVTLLN